jgi:hypothetical protein
MWRPRDELPMLLPYAIVYHLLLAGMLVYLFKKYSTCAPTTGKCSIIKSPDVAFGLSTGFLMGLLHISVYVYLPLSGLLALKWFVTSLFQGIGAGILLGMLYKRTTSSPCS